MLEVIRVTGVVFALLALILWGLAPIFAKLGLVEISPLLGLSIRTFVVASILLIFGLTTGEIAGLSKIDSRSALFLVGEGIFAGLLGHLAYFYGLKLSEASRVVPIAMAFPIITVVIGILFLHEGVSLTKIVGVPLVVGGIILLSL